MPGRTRQVRRWPGWTSRTTTRHVAFVSFSSGAVSLRGARGHRPPLACSASTCQRTETVKRRTWLGASAAGPTRLVVETRPVSGAFGWTPMLHPPLGPSAVGTPHPPSTGTTPGLALAGQEEGRPLSPCFRHPWLGACPWHCGELGVRCCGGRSSGASPTIDFCHQWDVTGDLQPARDGGLSPTGASCPPVLLPAKGSSRPSLAWPCHATRALGTGHHPWGQAAVPLQRGTRWGRGVFHRVFHMLAPAVSPLCPQPRPSSQSPSPCLLPALTTHFPHHRASLWLCCLSAVTPSFSPLPWHSSFSVRPCTGATSTGFLLLGQWWYWERRCCARMAFEAGSGVALR